MVLVSEFLLSLLFLKSFGLVVTHVFSSATAKTLAGMLAGRFLVGLGLGVGPPVASLYVTEVKLLSALGYDAFNYF